MAPYVIVLGNEKGGTGKSTVAMHIAVYLLNKGLEVGTIDLDARQGTFTRYFEHRKNASVGSDNIRIPNHVSILRSSAESEEKANEIDKEALEKALKERASCDFIVIDTPGSNTYLSQVAHSYANTLITPVNDSFVDLDVLVKVSGGDIRSMRPSVYSEMVWEQRKTRAIRGAKPIDWIVIRNRMTTLFTKNRKDVNLVLEALSKRIGFRLGAGFCERVIFREMFMSGLTVLDLDENGAQLSMSHVAARQELRDLITLMKLPTM